MINYYRLKFSFTPRRKLLGDFVSEVEGTLITLHRKDAVADVSFEFPLEPSVLQERYGEFKEEYPRWFPSASFPDLVDVKRIGAPTEFKQAMKYVEPSITTSGLKVNLGAGFERVPGFLSLDMLPEESITYEKGAMPKPDIVAEMPDLPFDDESVDVFRMRDVLVEQDLPFQKLLGREVKRCLKPGGLFVVIEHEGFKRAFSPLLKMKSSEQGGKVPYGPGFFWRTVYQKV